MPSCLFVTVLFATGFFQVEGELGSVILDDSFAAKLARSKGRQMLDSPSNLDPGVAESKDDDLTTSPSQTTVRPPELAGPFLTPVHPLTSLAHPPTLGNDDGGVADAKMEENDAPPESPRMDAGSMAVPEQLAGRVTVSSLVDPAHEPASASQISALHAALQGSIRANTAIHETMQEANRRHEMRAEMLEAKLEAFMSSMSDCLGATEQVAVERHDDHFE